MGYKYSYFYSCLQQGETMGIDYNWGVIGTDVELKDMEDILEAMSDYEWYVEDKTVITSFTPLWRRDEEV